MLVPDASARDRSLFDAAIELEQQLDLHVASFSAETAVYKVMGAPKVLQHYFNDLNDPRTETVALLGHNRYSTNTWPSFMRVQPFSVLGHNGEINTIARLRSEARMLGAPIRDDSSDSQDLNRLIETLIHRRGLSLPEAMELTVPPIVNEIRQFPEDLRGFYMYLRQAMGPFAQGPIALIARYGDELVFSVDALGLRPLWQIEAHDAYVFSSEPGVVSVADMTGEPKPLSPGEKVMVRIKRDHSARLYDHQEMQRLVHRRWLDRTGAEQVAGFEQAIPTGGPLEGPEIPGYAAAGPSEPVKVEEQGARRHGLAARGREARPADGVERRRADRLARIRRPARGAVARAPEPRRLLQGDGRGRDQPGDRPRARDRALLLPRGLRARPSMDHPDDDPRTIETAFPIILGGHDDMAPLSDEVYRRVAKEHKTYLLEDLWECFRGRGAVIDISCLETETVQGALERLKYEAAKKVLDGAELLVLSDRTAYEGERPFLDPHLVLSAIDGALRNYRVGAEEKNLRRRTAIVAALGRDPQRARRLHGARPGRGRHLPLRDDRGDLRRRLRAATSRTSARRFARASRR